MIKELISDLAYDKIKLSQALTRAKIIAYKIKNENFKQWIDRELNGYESADDINFPDYRKLYCSITIKVVFPSGQEKSYPVILENEIANIVNTFELHEPIPIIENLILSMKSQSSYSEISHRQLSILSNMYKRQLNEYDGMVTKGYRAINKTQLQNIIELTKNKLLDTLMELDSEFPSLINEYENSKENIDKVQTIITNNISGNTGPMNIATGQQVEQKDNQIIENFIDFNKLKELGVEEEKINEIIKIVSNNKSDKDTLKKKTMKWLGSVTASIASKGLYDNIPSIVEFAEKLF